MARSSQTRKSKGSKKEPTVAGRTIRVYRSYNFVDKDPIIDEFRTAFQDSGATKRFVEERSGVTSQTLNNWFDGKTRRPQFATVKAAARAIGYDIRLVKDEGKKR